MYNDVPVLDVHGHVAVPFGATSFLMLMMGSNTAMTSPIGQDPAGPGRVTLEDFRTAADGHAAYMDERNIDVQVIGPRPFLTMGWMEPHLLPAWASYVNDMIRQQCSMFPDYQLGFMTDQYLAGQFLSHGTVFTRYPELKVIICHCGGALDRFTPTDHHIAQKDLSENLFYDTCGYDLNFLEAAIKQRGVGRMLFGTEAPGSGRAVRPETGRTSDDLVPAIGGFGFLSEADKVAIFNANPAKEVPAFAKSSPGRTTHG